MDNSQRYQKAVNLIYSKAVLEKLSKLSGIREDDLFEYIGFFPTKPIDDTLARSIEIVFDQPRGWLDQYSTADLSDALSASEP